MDNRFNNASIVGVRYVYQVIWAHTKPSFLQLPEIFTRSNGRWFIDDTIVTDENGEPVSIPSIASNLTNAYENIEWVIQSKIKSIIKNMKQIEFQYDKKVLAEAEQFLIDIKIQKAKDLENYPERFI